MRGAGVPMVTIELNGPEGLAVELLQMGDCDRAGLFAARARSFPRSRHPREQDKDRANIGADRDQAPISCTRHSRARRRNRAVCRRRKTSADLGTEYDRGTAYFFGLRHPQGYIALLPFLSFGEAPKIVFRRIRERLESTLGLPVLETLGPSYLHTIGQVYQGGPAKGLFLLLTRVPSEGPLHSRRGLLLRAVATRARTG